MFWTLWKSNVIFGPDPAAARGSCAFESAWQLQSLRPPCAQEKSTLRKVQYTVCALFDDATSHGHVVVYSLLNDCSLAVPVFLVSCFPHHRFRTSAYHSPLCVSVDSVISKLAAHQVEFRFEYKVDIHWLKTKEKLFDQSEPTTSFFILEVTCTAYANLNER